MPKNITKRRRKPTAYSPNRCLLPYLVAPVANWDRIHRRQLARARRSKSGFGPNPVSDALSLVEGYTLLGIYLQARSWSATHEAAGASAYRALIRVRRALGCKHYKECLNPFRYA